MVITTIINSYYSKSYRLFHLLFAASPSLKQDTPISLDLEYVMEIINSFQSHAFPSHSVRIVTKAMPLQSEHGRRVYMYALCIEADFRSEIERGEIRECCYGYGR